MQIFPPVVLVKGFCAKNSNIFLFYHHFTLSVYLQNQVVLSSFETFVKQPVLKSLYQTDQAVMF